MKNDLTPKQEKFARAVAEGLPFCDAYRQAYTTKGTDKTVNEAASRLMADTNISARVEALKAEIAATVVERSARTREDLLDKLDVVFDDAMGGERKAHGAAVQAVATQAKLLGLDVQKVEVRDERQAREQEVLDNLTDGQMVRASLALLRKHCNGPERSEIVEFAQHVMEGEGYAFD